MKQHYRIKYESIASGKSSKKNLVEIRIGTVWTHDIVCCWEVMEYVS